MGMRMVKIMILILALNSSAIWMNASGFSDHLGVEHQTGLEDEIKQFDRSGEGFVSSDASVSDYLGFTVAALKYIFVSFIWLGATESAMYSVGFPGWFVFPLINFVARPIWTLGGIQLLRGVIAE